AVPAAPSACEFFAIGEFFVLRGFRVRHDLPLPMQSARPRRAHDPFFARAAHARPPHTLRSANFATASARFCAKLLTPYQGVLRLMHGAPLPLCALLDHAGSFRRCAAFSFAGAVERLRRAYLRRAWRRSREAIGGFASPWLG